MVEKCPQRQTCGRLGASSIMCVLVLAVPAAATGQWLTVQPAWHACGCVQMLAGVSAFKRERDYFTMQQVLSFPHAFTLNFPNHVPGVAKVRFASSRHVVTWRRSHNGFLRYGPGPGVDVMLQDLVLSMLQPQPERRLGAGPKDSKLSFAALRVRTLVQCRVHRVEWRAVVLTPCAVLVLQRHEFFRQYGRSSSGLSYVPPRVKLQAQGPQTQRRGGVTQAGQGSVDCVSAPPPCDSWEHVRRRARASKGAVRADMTAHGGGSATATRASYRVQRTDGGAGAATGSHVAAIDSHSTTGARYAAAQWCVCAVGLTTPHRWLNRSLPRSQARRAGAVKSPWCVGVAC